MKFTILSFCGVGIAAGVTQGAAGIEGVFRVGQRTRGE